MIFEFRILEILRKIIKNQNVQDIERRNVLLKPRGGRNKKRRLIFWTALDE